MLKLLFFIGSMCAFTGTVTTPPSGGQCVTTFEASNADYAVASQDCQGISMASPCNVEFHCQWAKAPTEAPTAAPTEAPTAAPTEAPTAAATSPTTSPTALPTRAPSEDGLAVQVPQILEDFTVDVEVVDAPKSASSEPSLVSTPDPVAVGEHSVAVTKDPVVVLSSVVRVDLRDANGSKVSIHDLAKPIRITIPLKLDGDESTALDSSTPSDLGLGQRFCGCAIVACAFLEEETNQWSTQGLKTQLRLEDQTADCLTTHLTDFALLRFRRALPGCLDSEGLDAMIFTFIAIYVAFTVVCCVQIFRATVLAKNKNKVLISQHGLISLLCFVRFFGLLQHLGYLVPHGSSPFWAALLCTLPYTLFFSIFFQFINQWATHVHQGHKLIDLQHQKRIARFGIAGNVVASMACVVTLLIVGTSGVTEGEGVGYIAAIAVFVSVYVTVGTTFFCYALAMRKKLAKSAADVGDTDAAYMQLQNRLLILSGVVLFCFLGEGISLVVAVSSGVLNEASIIGSTAAFLTFELAAVTAVLWVYSTIVASGLKSQTSQINMHSSKSTAVTSMTKASAMTSRQTSTDKRRWGELTNSPISGTSVSTSISRHP